MTDGTLTLANYQLRLPDFEGPLDLLLRLIERSQLAIEDVSLVAVTDQFLAVIAEMQGNAPPETIAEFATVGTRLTLLKSRSLLPRPPKPDEEEILQSDLAAELAEYKRMKDVAQQLGERFAAGASLFTPATRTPVAIPTESKESLRLVQYEPSVLLRSIRRRLTTVPKPIQILRQRRIISIREMIGRVAELTHLRPTTFTSITAEYQSRTEVATAFLAVLVLVRRRSLQATQGALFAEIALERTLADEGVDGTVYDEEFVN